VISGEQVLSKVTPSAAAAVALQEGVTAAKALALQKATQAAAIIFMFINTSKKSVEEIFRSAEQNAVAVRMTPITEMVNLHSCSDVIVVFCLSFFTALALLGVND
jgi:hypothetical protein